MIPPRIDRIVLVGFMGCGKSTVGRMLARRLDWAFLDTDVLVAAEVGMSVAEIFVRHGEPFFREREHRVTLEQLGRDRVVLATGGGWPAVDGRMDALPEGTASVWLEVPLPDLMARLERRPGVRPLLDTADPRGRVESLLARRAPFYGQATVSVDGTETPAVVAEQILHGLGPSIPHAGEPSTNETRS